MVLSDDISRCSAVFAQVEGTLREKSLAKARSIFGSLQKWATGPCSEGCFSGAGLMMKLTRPGLGTGTLIHPLRRAVWLLCRSHTNCRKVRAERDCRSDFAYQTAATCFLICTSIIDTSPEQACSANLTLDLLVLNQSFAIFCKTPMKSDLGREQKSGV